MVVWILFLMFVVLLLMYRLLQMSCFQPDICCTPECFTGVAPEEAISPSVTPVPTPIPTPTYSSSPYHLTPTVSGTPTPSVTPTGKRQLLTLSPKPQFLST
ncbi:uncharacterized protein LOC143035310 [Oratosquilla oratoria]|uniref:uncharacterized protein LOC143035310 n=1 Tax=Oratosquilla oratoria TaxID=337810 RepID=UPI003F75F4B3